MIDPANETLKGKGGRPKGLGKVPGSGRRKGTPNKSRAATLEQINLYSDPIGFLQKVCRGLLVECRDSDASDPKASVLMRPTLEQRINAATILSKKVLPDSRAVELGGPGGGELTINVIENPHGP